jgi:quinol monooxygenase YgiN
MEPPAAFFARGPAPRGPQTQRSASFRQAARGALGGPLRTGEPAPMRHRIARFKVRPAEVAAAEKAIIAFVAKVAEEPGTLRYESFREADGVTYVHVMTFADDAAEADHGASDHVKKFNADLVPRCEVQPVFTDLKKISGAGR